MSMCYWMIEGIGLCASSLEPHLSKEKVVRFLHKQLPNNEEITELVRTGNFEELDLEGLTCAWDRPYGTGSVSLRDILYSFFDGRIGDLLAHCDDTDTLTFCDDGDGNEYFYYPPSMPWHRTENEPDSAEEVHRRIIKAVQCLTDLSETEIEKMIDDDLYVCGCG